MKLSSGELVYPSTPIYPNSNFTWGEATRNCTRQPYDLIIDGVLLCSAVSIEANIINTAKKLDEIRAVLGNRPLWVNSWYRPPIINRRVGGSKHSRHQHGDAVDIRSDYFLPRHIFGKLRKHQGGLSCYKTFVHIDWRGYKARW